jgi:hypothetical protein
LGDRLELEEGTRETVVDLGADYIAAVATEEGKGLWVRVKA